jgi:predicted metal-dependent phosphoesterase TrpH
MQYKTELHCHSSEVSPCADLTVAEVTERYIAAGYTTLVLTNHYCDYVMDNAGKTWSEKIEHYLSAYHAMKEYAGDRLQILLGCELRFVENHNDYLIFGLTEEFLIEHPNLHEMTLKTFSALSRESGLLLFWAHPFRNRMTTVPPKYLDGIEVFNAHTGHDSRNHLANAYAETYGLLKSSGSDFHHPHSVEGGGILTDEPITSMEQLVTCLKEQSFELICEGPAATRDGMRSMSARNKVKER